MGKDNGSDEAAQARADENARQARIRAGTSRINTIFDGGTTTSGAVTGAYDPTKTYYNADGSVWTPTAAPTTPAPAANGALGNGPHRANYGGGGARNGGIGVSAGVDGRGGSVRTNPFSRVQTPEQQFAAAEKNGLFGTKTTTPGFDDAFYTGRRDAYTNYAMPQLDQQNSDASKQLTFSLDRGGLLDSSVRGQKLSDLQRLYDTNKQAVADKALSYETSARNSVEDARSNLISTLNATGDAEGAATSALARSQALSAPAAYDPLGQLFTDFTNGLGIQAAQERSYAAGGAKPAYNTGLFSNTGRISVTG